MGASKRKTSAQPTKARRAIAKTSSSTEGLKLRVVAVSGLAQGVIDQIATLKANLTRDPGATNVQVADLDGLIVNATELKTSIDTLGAA